MPDIKASDNIGYAQNEISNPGLFSDVREKADAVEFIFDGETKPEKWSYFIQLLKVPIFPFADVESPYIGNLAVHLKDGNTDVSKISGQLNSILDNINELPVPKSIDGTSSNVNERILDIKMPRVTTYLHHSLPLSFILTDENNLFWFYNNFISIRTYICDIRGNVRVDYNYPKYAEVMSTSSVGPNEIFSDEDMITYIIERINEGHYLAVILDEYHIPGKGAYNSTQFYHESLIYGYDNSKREFYALGMLKNGNLGVFAMDYDAFLKAFYYRAALLGKNTDYIRLITLDKGDVDSRKLDVSEYIKSLDAYISGKGSIDTDCANKEISRWQYDENTISAYKYGIDVVEAVIKSLKGNFGCVKKVDYRALHLLYEHKLLLFDSFKFISNNYVEGFENITRRFSGVVEAYNIPLLKYMKYWVSVSDKSDFLAVINYFKPEWIDDLAGNLEKARQKEMEVLTDIISHMKAH